MAVYKNDIQLHAVLASQAFAEVYLCLGTPHRVLAHDGFLVNIRIRGEILFQCVCLFGSVSTGFVISSRAVAWRFVSDVAKYIWRGHSITARVFWYPEIIRSPGVQFSSRSV